MSLISSMAELRHGQVADFFAQLIQKESVLKRDGRPYFSLVFRDAARDVRAAIWEGGPLENECRETWSVGEFYKIRARFDESMLGGSIRIERLRPVAPKDSENGFSPEQCVPQSKHDTDDLLEALLQLVETKIQTADLQQLVVALLEDHAEPLCNLPASLRHHHVYRGGYIEHVFSVTTLVIQLIELYRRQHESLRDPLTCDLAVAGAIVHDLGKLAELDATSGYTTYSTAGELVGHVVLGRDLIRDLAQKLELDAEWLVRLEHVILSHQLGPDHGSPKSPMTWEAHLVAWADELDGKVFRLAKAWDEIPAGPSSLRDNKSLGNKLFRPEKLESSSDST